MKRELVELKIRELDKELNKGYFILDNCNYNKKEIKICERHINNILNKEGKLIGKIEE